MRTFPALVIALAIAGLGALWWLKFERGEPAALILPHVEALGRQTPFEVRVSPGTAPLRSISVRLRVAEGDRQGAVFDLARETYPPPSWREGAVERQLRVEVDLAQLGVPEGPAAIEVVAETYAWRLWRAERGPLLALPVEVDLTPPRVEVLSAPHNLRLGGADLAVFRQSADTVRSGIAVDGYFFPATRGYFSDGEIAVALFAAPQDLAGEIRFQVVAADAAGNERRVDLPARLKLRRFAERTLAISDGFLQRKVPEIMAASRVSPAGSLLDQYLYINRQLRAQNEARIRELTAASHPAPLWDGPFRRQPNAAPISSFADRRTYEYNGQVIDHQTHLGFDLASTRMAAVPAAQNGIVVFADHLGIYGNAVILDHGLGVFTLYGHLSSVSVKPGDRVRAEELLGRTGESGLAGGDHLHFSVMLHGVHIDPIEWWDAHWMRDHVASRLALFPRAAVMTAETGS